MPDTWNPKLAVLASRAIPDNLLEYITNESRQGAVLTWAGGAGLKLLATRIQRQADKTKPQYPAIEFSDDNDAKQYANDVVPGAYSLVFEVAIQNADPDEAIRQGRIYSKAVESMILNIPKETLLEGTGAFGATLQTIETGFEKLKNHKERKNDFLQVFQTRPTWTLQASFRT